MPENKFQKFVKRKHRERKEGLVLLEERLDSFKKGFRAGFFVARGFQTTLQHLFKLIAIPAGPAMFQVNLDFLDRDTIHITINKPIEQFERFATIHTRTPFCVIPAVSPEH